MNNQEKTNSANISADVVNSPLLCNVSSCDFGYMIINQENLELGEGKFGTVFKGRYLQEPRKNSIIAIKEHKSHEFALNEVDSYLQCGCHPNLCGFIGYSKVDNHNTRKSRTVSSINDSLPTTAIILEYMPNNLETIFCKSSFRSEYIQENKFISLLISFAKGLNHMHSRFVYHGDLGARNLLISTKDRLVIAGLALAHCRNVGDLNTDCDIDQKNQPAVRWGAPEVFEHGKYSDKSDVWSWAVTVWELWKGERPYNNIEDIDAVKKLLLEKQFILAKPEYPSSENVSHLQFFWDELFQLLETCWNYQPAKRPSALQLINSLELLGKKI